MVITVAVLTGVAAAVIGFVIYCLIDLRRSEMVRTLEKGTWAVIILLSMPWGGIAYLIFGRPRSNSLLERSTGSRSRTTEHPHPTPNAPVQMPPVTVGRSGGTITVASMTKQFGSTVAVDNLTFEVHPGHVTGFLGPNGAGKTTTMRVILGLERPDSGHALVNGVAYRSMSQPLRTVGALLDTEAAHPGRSAWSHILSVATSNGISSRRVNEVLELTGLAPVAHRRVKEFSLGMKQRLGMAIALLGDPPFLVLDEPVNGLDPEGVKWIRELLRSLASEGRTVLVSSHLMSEMELTADRLIIIGGGRLLADTPMTDFVEASSRRDVFVRSPHADALCRALIDASATVDQVGGDALAVIGLTPPAIAKIASNLDIPIVELTPRHASLEDAYLDLTRRSAMASATPGATASLSPGSAP